MEITLRDVLKQYKKTTSPSLTEVNLTLKSGDTVGLIGHNGSGKTTLLNIISSAITASDGSYLLDGTDITQKPEMIRYRMGYFSDPERSLYLRLTANENIDRFCKLKGTYGQRKTKEGVRLLARRLGLEDHLNRQVRYFSKGMKVKVNIMLALLGDHDLLIMDEPFAGLDGNVILELMDILKEQTQEGKLMIISSNELAELELFCNRIIALNMGHIVFDGSVEEALRQIPGDSVIEVVCLDPLHVAEMLGNQGELHTKDSVIYQDKILLMSGSPMEDYGFLKKNAAYKDLNVTLRNKNLYDFLKIYSGGVQ